GIAAVSANDIWAVGRNDTETLTEHWDGTSWKIVNSPNPGNLSNALSGVTALSDGTVAAVGGQGSATTGTTPLILQNAASAPKTWHPTRDPLHVVASPTIPNSQLLATTAIAANDIWAVGDVLSSSGTFTTLAEHIDATSWSVV